MHAADTSRRPGAISRRANPPSDVRLRMRGITSLRPSFAVSLTVVLLALVLPTLQLPTTGGAIARNPVAGAASVVPNSVPAQKVPVVNLDSRVAGRAVSVATSGSVTDRASPNLPASVVNPTQFYSREPAPMGIADFGVDGPGTGSVGYSYSSAAFEGQASIHSMSITISGSTSKVMAFELNAVVLLQKD